ncbi:helix-turn-helix domain-containing protein [Streptomyces xinghaiensis]|uniref:helix-turn-helix domain-containing protein n=1 Tax=Streptomyces xinghaiensis TaxID=1038928 RepID=UPI0034289001
MPPRSHPTARQERLGAELRKMRERAGMTAREAGELLGTGPIQISHIEAGRIGVSEERLRRLASHYRCTDAELVDALVSMATERGRGWWEAYRGVLSSRSLDLAELEHRATRLCSLEIVHVPGILQTEDYIRAIHTYAGPQPTADYLEAVVGFRLQRGQALVGKPAHHLSAVIHEAALRIRVGDRKVAREQLAFLLDVAEDPTAMVRVIPFDVDGFAGSGYSMLYAEGPVADLDTVHLDAAHGSVFLHAEAQLDAYRGLFEKAADLALSPADSRKMISRIARDL